MNFSVIQPGIKPAIINDSSALTDDWFSRPYDELLAEATRVGALVGSAEHITRWSPDTCKCKLDQISHGVTIRVIDNKKQIREIFVVDPTKNITEGESINLCPSHAHLLFPKDHFDVVLEENQRKNRFQAAIGYDLPYKWSFDVNRILVVDVNGLTPLIANAIRSLVNDPQFKNKVIING